ncbi:MAG: InlB B-repeat-containing protein [Clostridia bacterium]|nr:InlB B-repeat-containing protein [Clostridia bacterium]
MALSFVTLTACDTLDDFFGKGNGDGSVYSVTLETNGGTFNSTVTEYTSGSQCALPTDGTKEHYTFDGWYDNSNFTGSSVTKIPASATGDKTYYAKWTPDSYNITFNVTGEASTQDTYTYGVVKTLTTPTKDGYTFNGWYANSNLSGSVTQINAGEYGDKTFFGEWVSQGTPVQTYTVTLHENGGTYVNGGLTSYTAGVGATLPAISRSGYTFNGWYDNENFNGNPVTQIAANATGNKEYWASWTKISSGSLAVIACAGYEEGAYVEFNTVSGVSSYSVAYKASGASAYTTIDDELVRVDTANGVVRADAVGLKAGDYTLKVTAGSQTAERPVTVTAYDRSGYAHFNYTSGVGGYNDDGTPKSGAVIVYVTEATKNTVSAKIGSKTYTGLKNILAAATTGTPVIVRIVGRIAAPTWAHDGDNQIIEYTKAGNKLTSAEAIAQTNTKFGTNLGSGSYKQSDLTEITVNGKKVFNLEEGISALDGLTSTMTLGSDTCWNNMSIGGSSSHPQNITVEGIGTDAEIFQWGFTWRYAKSIEIRNITFDDYTEDACSFEGGSNYDNVDSFDSQRIWVHNNTFNEGRNYWDASDDQDKHEGDGATDFKRCSYITISYNHYYENHKTGLIGSDNSSKTANVTFHHNYYDTCQSRLPLARQANMHMYNNYYHDSNTSISLRSYAYAFIENCYFDGSNNTMIDIQSYNSSTANSYGVAKIYNCVLNGKGYSYQAMPEIEQPKDTAMHSPFIVVVNNRTNTVANNNMFYQDFDTNSSVFYYDSANKKSSVTRMDDTADVPTVIPQLSGVHKN